MAQRYFATCAPGLEEALVREIRDLGGRKATPVRGGVEFGATNPVFYRVLYQLRTANRLVMRVDEFRARDTPELYNKTRRYDWERLLSAANKVYVRAHTRRSRIIHSGLAARTVGDGLRAHFAEVLGADAPEIVEEARDADVMVVARLEEDRCELSLDAAGELLYRRGWRARVGAAPIRETVAAACLRLADWRPEEPVFDPTCGSGTFPIEAAQIATGIPSGAHRDFALFDWANFRAELWNEVVAEAARAQQEPPARYYGADRAPEMVETARVNADRAEVGAWCVFDEGDAARMTPPTTGPGLVICNPPYGERLEEGGVIDGIIARFAEAFGGWRLAMVLPEAFEPAHEGLTFEARARFKNGGIPVRLWVAG